MEELINRLRQQNIDIDVVDDRLKLRIPAGLEATALVQELQANKEPLIAYIKKMKAPAGNTETDTGWFDIASLQKPATPHYDNLYEVTNQVRKEYLRYRVIGPFANNLSFYLPFEQLHRPSLETAIAALVQRHESLRTCFKQMEGTVYQQIYPSTFKSFTITCTNISDDENKDERLREIYRKTVATRFDFENGPFVTFAIVQYSEYLHGLLVVIHHIIADAVSLDIMKKELRQLYALYKDGSGDTLPPLKVTFRQYASWANRFIDGPKGMEAQQFYKTKIEESLSINKEMQPVTSYRSHLAEELWALLKKDPLPDYAGAFGTLVHLYKPEGAVYTTYISEYMMQRLKKLAVSSGSGLFITMIASFALLFYQSNKQNSVRIYLPFSTRVCEDLENMIGWLTGETINCITVDPSLTIQQFIAAVGQTVIETSKYRMYPCEKILFDLDMPLSTVAPVFLNLISAAENTISNFSPVHDSYGSGHFSFSCTVTEYRNGLSLKTHYNTKVYQADGIERLFDKYFLLLEEMVSHRSLPIGALPASHCGLHRCENCRKAIPCQNSFDTARHPSSL